MPQLPSGTVTFLFTDIEGSTELVRRLRERYHEVLGEHQRIVRGAVTEAGETGDRHARRLVLLRLSTRPRRVLAAANAQRALAAHDWPEDGVIRVRMGIHTGEAAAVDGRYVGVAVHRAARISASGHGGQVLLSQTTHNLLEDEEELPLDLRDMGEQRLKDFDRPVRVYQLDIPGLQERFPPLTTTPKREPRLPRVGRGGRKWLAVAALGVMGAAAIAVALVLLLKGGGGAPLSSPGRWP